MGYHHDIFVSYKRDPETLSWIGNHFLPLLKVTLSHWLQRDPDIYIHEITDNIQVGTAWPVELGEKISASRVLIALWSGNYMTSRWCAKELCLMLAREKEAKCRTTDNKYGLVIPVIVHDGENVCKIVGNTQNLDIKPCFNTRMRKDSLKAEELFERLRDHAEGISNAILHAPPWKEEWRTHSAEELMNIYLQPDPQQAGVPRLAKT
jgi:hypothetical protein